VVDEIREDTNEKIAVFAREIMKKYTAKKERILLIVSLFLPKSNYRQIRKKLKRWKQVTDLV
jgi:hypothetical protein